MNSLILFRPCPKRAFTLVELLVSITVLVLIIVLLGQAFSSASQTTSLSLGRLESDNQARQAFDRIARDLADIIDRQDLTYSLDKRSGNDEFHFYSQVPGVLEDRGASPSGLSLVGYRVQEGKLERLANAQTYDDLKFLTYDENDRLIDSTTIDDAVQSTPDPDYHILCDGVFRMEIGFILKDGTFSDLPILDVEPNPGTEVGTREWRQALNFAEVCVIDLPDDGRTVYRPLGWQDVSAIVITLAVIDRKALGRFNAATMAAAGANLDDARSSQDPSEVVFPAERWLRTLSNPDALNVPRTAQQRIRVYERAFYLNTP